MARWRHRLAAFAERVRPADVDGRDAEALDLLATLLEAAATATATDRAAARGRGVARRSLELLEADLADPLDLRAVAAEVAHALRDVAPALPGETGTSPYAHRAARRLAAATDLLVHTGLGVRDIAAATGFSDERHLIRRFREDTGLTPRAFRDDSR